jgi:hypothetical protein
LPCVRLPGPVRHLMKSFAGFPYWTLSGAGRDGSFFEKIRIFRNHRYASFFDIRPRTRENHNIVDLNDRSAGERGSTNIRNFLGDSF